MNVVLIKKRDIFIVCGIMYSDGIVHSFLLQITAKLIFKFFYSYILKAVKFFG